MPRTSSTPEPHDQSKKLTNNVAPSKPAKVAPSFKFESFAPDVINSIAKKVIQIQARKDRPKRVLSDEQKTVLRERLAKGRVNKQASSQ